MPQTKKNRTSRVNNPRHEQIIAWNQDVERGKAISGDLWISWSVSPVYNDLQCIEYPDWEGK